jgi:hypothetical protein
VRSGSSGELSSNESEFLHKRSKPKGRQGMDVAVDSEAQDTFYRAAEGGETVPWRRNNRRWVELFNDSVSVRRE